MDPLTYDLIVTLLASVSVLAAGGLAVWVLPWSDEAWAPRERPQPAPRRDLPVRLIDLTNP